MVGSIKKPKINKNYKLFGKTYRTTDTIIGWSFLLPAVLLGIIFVIMPIVISLAYSFTDANLLQLDQVKFIGFTNFKDAFQDKILFQAFKNTMEFVLSNSLQLEPLGFGINFKQTD